MNTVIEQLIDNYNPKNSEEVKNASTYMKNSMVMINSILMIVLLEVCYHIF